MKNIMVNLKDMSNIQILQPHDAEDHTAVIAVNVAIGGDSVILLTLGSVIENPILGNGLARWIATQDEKNNNKNHEDMYKMIIKRDAAIRVPIGNPSDGLTRVLRISYDEEVYDEQQQPPHATNIAEPQGGSTTDAATTSTTAATAEPVPIPELNPESPTDE